MIKMSPIKPKKKFLGNMNAVKEAIEDSLDTVADAAKEMEYKTVDSWEHGVIFRIVKSPYARLIGTDHPLWQMLDQGTKPHLIRRRRYSTLAFKVGGFRPKTKPRVIGSSKGAQGQHWRTPVAVNHPGTQPREWVDEIGTRSEKRLAAVIARKLGQVTKK